MPSRKLRNIKLCLTLGTRLKLHANSVGGGLWTAILLGSGSLTEVDPSAGAGLMQPVASLPRVQAHPPNVGHAKYIADAALTWIRHEEVDRPRRNARHGHDTRAATMHHSTATVERPNALTFTGQIANTRERTTAAHLKRRDLRATPGSTGKQHYEQIANTNKFAVRLPVEAEFFAGTLDPCLGLGRLLELFARDFSQRAGGVGATGLPHVPLLLPPTRRRVAG